MEAWLDGVLAAAGAGGGARIDVDYDLYAEGEAALGWLNAGHRAAARGQRSIGAKALDELMERIVEDIEESHGRAPRISNAC